MSTTDEDARETLATAMSILFERMKSGEYPDASEEVLADCYIIWLSGPSSLARYRYGVWCTLEDGSAVVGTTYQNHHVGIQGRYDEVTVVCRDLERALQVALADAAGSLASLDLDDEEVRHWAHMELEANRRHEAETFRIIITKSEQPPTTAQLHALPPRPAFLRPRAAHPSVPDAHGKAEGHDLQPLQPSTRPLDENADLAAKVMATEILRYVADNPGAIEYWEWRVATGVDLYHWSMSSTDGGDCDNLAEFLHHHLDEFRELVRKHIEGDFVPALHGNVVRTINWAARRIVDGKLPRDFQVDEEDRNALTARVAELEAGMRAERVEVRSQAEDDTHYVPVSDADWRARNVRDIGAFFGAPGEAWDTHEGEGLVIATLRACGGLAALTDGAIAHLADAHGALAEQLTREA